MNIAHLVVEYVGWVVIGIVSGALGIRAVTFACKFLYGVFVLGPAHRQERLRYLILLDLRNQYRGISRGSDCRQRIGDGGFKCSGPEFYQAVAWLVNANQLTRWYERDEVGGQPIKETWIGL